MIKNVVEALEGIVLLQTGYSKLTHVWDISKNHNTKLEKKFGVLPLSIKEINGTTNAVTYMQDFSIVLCDKYIHEAQNDNKKQEKVFDLMDKWMLVYKEMLKSRFNLANSIISCTFAKVDKPLFDEDSKTIFLFGTITLLYRNIL